MNFKTIHKIKFVLANSAEAVAGMPACIDRTAGSTQGQAVPAAVDTNLIPVGRFCETMTGNGTDEVEVELFNAKKIHFFANDGTVPVDAADILGPAYFTDANEVGVPADPSTYSLAGRVWIVESTRVGVETADAIGLQGEPGV